MERTISMMVGKGSLNHNNRTFTAKNVDAERSKANKVYVKENLKKVYHTLFDEELEAYNAKQTRADRRIDNYYEKIRTSKQEKLFHELIVQIGNKDDMNAKDWQGQIAKDILVLTAGCSSGGLENIGLMTPEAAELAGPNLKAVCKELGIPPVLNFGPCLAIGRLEIVATEIAEELGVDLPQLPLVLSAAQWLEEQALADGAFALALGLPLHLGVPPFITGSKLVTKVLTEDMVGLTGGRVIVDGDGKSAANTLEAIIEEKRKALNI